MEIGLVRNVDIDHEMQQSYLDYAMSVIVARALPDARDGLKPVQRRILYGMYDMGLRADSPFKKSARIVGEVLGKYHPHGDQAVYEAMARMAQDFSMRYPLIDGQGNFGSVDGDPPAAMRYTEARLTPLALDILKQLDRNTVDFSRNFDDSMNEPEVLPAAVPNLLINGVSGIAVGMATSIPPHNLSEVIDALNYLLQHWEKLEDVSVDQLMKFIQGPDFPTGGIILQENGNADLLTAYATGKGKVTLRGRVQLEDMGRGKSRIIITELPYQINKASLIERIAELARENVLEGISDLRDESDRQGMRVVIELNKAAEESDVLRELYRRTPLQSTFRISLLALVDGEPRLLSLKQALKVYLEHRITVIKRRSEFDLEKARQRAHILEGLRVALNNLDEVINLIRRAADVDDARAKLMRRYRLTELQANAILEMQLRRLAALERKKIELEYQDTLKLIKELELLLRSPKKLRQAVAEELTAIQQAYGDRRRTQIVSLREGEAARNVLTTSDLIPEQTVWVGVSEDGMIGRTNSDRLPRTSGRQAPRWLLATNTHHTLYLVGADGRAAAISAQTLPEVESFTDGIPLHKASAFEPGMQLAQIISLPAKIAETEERYVMTVSTYGMVKKSAVNELPGPSAQLFNLARVNPGDSIGWVFVTDGKSQIVLVTQFGMMIRFDESSVRPMGLAAGGVNGIKLGNQDCLIAAFRFDEKADLLLVGADGRGWRLPSSQIILQGRYGQGTIACRPPKGGELVGALYGRANETGLLHLKELAAKSIRVDQIPAGRRSSAAREILALKPGDRVVAVTPFVDGLSDWVKKGRGRANEGGDGSPAQKSSRTAAPKTRARRSVTKAAAKPAQSRAEKPTAARTSPKKPAEPTGKKKISATPDAGGSAKTTRKSEPKTRAVRSAAPAVRKTASAGAEKTAAGKTAAGKTAGSAAEKNQVTTTTGPRRSTKTTAPAAGQKPRSAGSTAKKTTSAGKTTARSGTVGHPPAGSRAKTSTKTSPVRSKSGTKGSTSSKTKANPKPEESAPKRRGRKPKAQ